jgi:hypothetical protein
MVDDEFAVSALPLCLVLVTITSVCSFNARTGEVR